MIFLLVNLSRSLEGLEITGMRWIPCGAISPIFCQNTPRLLVLGYFVQPRNVKTQQRAGSGSLAGQYPLIFCQNTPRNTCVGIGVGIGIGIEYLC